MTILKQTRQLASKCGTVLKWGLLALLVGAIGGLLGTAFHKTLHFVTGLRGAQPWLLYLLPVGGLLTVGIYRLLRMEHNRGTNEIIDAILDGKPVSALVAPAIYAATSITHLFGGSAGREGAALQLGGSFASLLARWLKLTENERTVLIMCGMSAVFAALFGTPLTACLFTMEFGSVGMFFSPALLPSYLSAFTASRISAAFGVHAESILLAAPASLALHQLWRYLLLAVLISLLGILMCRVFHCAEHLAKKWLSDPFLRIVCGAVIVVGMTLLVGDQRFNGAGMEMALAAIEGHADWYAFLLKLLFTAVTLAAGFKGGEIVPTFCIGATFGCALGGLIGLEPGMAAALGLVGLFCCATNSPLTTIVLSVEMFGSANLHLFALVSVITYVISGNSGLYTSQLIQFTRAPLAGTPALSLRNRSRNGAKPSAAAEEAHKA